MKKLWEVFFYEYARHVLRKRFIFAALSLPIFIGIILAVSILSSVGQNDTRPIGYVDHSGLLAHPVEPKSTGTELFSKPVKIVAYPSEEEARTALEEGTIQGFYALGVDYLQTSNAQLVFQKEPAVQVKSQFETFLVANLLASQPPEIANRLVEGTNLIVQSLDGSRTMSDQDWFNILVPLIAAIIFLVVVMTTGGYLMQAVVEEKENRTMEMIVTSVSPEQLMGGKILGDICVGLTQLGIWLAFTAIGFLVGRNSVEWISHIQIPPSYLFLMVATLLPSFVMIAGIMATIGATVTEMREAQQMTGLFSLPIAAPFWLVYSLMTHPNGPIAQILSYFPLTAPVTLLLRAGFTEIPPGQLAANLAALYLFAIASIWVAARAFRLGMLSYGKRISFKQIFNRSVA